MHKATERHINIYESNYFEKNYKKYFSFSDLEKFLIPQNFRFTAINLNNNNLFTGSIFFADVLYLNKKKI